MKHNLRSLVGVGIALSLLLITPLVAAETGSGTSDSNTTTTTTNTSTESEKPTEAEKVEIRQRVDKLKTELKVKLTARQEERLKTRCIPAQAIVKTTDDRFSTNVNFRTKSYEELTTKLTNLQAKLKTNGVDTTTLEQQLAVLQTKIATYKTDLAAYKQTMSDLRKVDCAADPSGFQAALQTARTAHDKVAKDASDIKTYLSGTIKPTLKAIREQLAAKEQKTDNSSTNGGSN